MDSADVAEIKKHFGVVAEGLESRIRQVGEAVEGVRFELSTFKQEVHQEFEETRAMIRLSYSELDRRLRGLKAGHSNLESRVERLETR